MNPGDVVAGQYEVRELAGRGGMGAVYRARDRSSGEQIALKVLHASESDAGQRFVREARAMAELHHPGIVRYLGHGRTERGELFIAMEWLEGESLSERLKRTGVTIAEAVSLIRSTSEALAAVHKRGIVHRDLKPSNLFLLDGDPERVKLVDFGIVRLAGTAALTVTGAMVGTPGYMAPEQARGERDIDARADVFALGCVLFKCLTGEAPFTGDDMLAVMLKIVVEEAPRVRDVRSDVPTDLDALVSRMLAKRREDRPPDGAALVDAIDALGPIDADTVSRRVVGAPSITGHEQRVHCLVLARISEIAPPTEDEETKIVAPHEATDEHTADTKAFEERESKLLALRMAVDRYRGRLELLADGSLLTTLESSGAATDQAVRAARCAIAMQDGLGKVPMAVVAGRTVVAGRSPMGEVIERGASLLAQSQGDIRLDEVTAGLLDGRFDIGGDRRGLVLRGEKDAADGARTLLGRQTPCVGREREIASLLGFYEECVEEPMAHAVLVTASAGIGKSRLRYEFLQRLAEQEAEAEIWVARGDPMSAGSPFGLIAQPIRRVAGLREGEELVVRIQKLRARVGRHVAPPDIPRVAQFLGEMCGVPFPDMDSVELRAARRDPMLMGDQIRRALEDFLAAECEHQPVVLVLEDLHWGDLPTVKLVDALLRHATNAPFMVLALARPEVHDMFPKLWAERELQEVRLRELTKKGAERLVRGVLGDRVEDETVELMVKRAAGNAFYLEELIRAVAEGRGSELPQSVIAMVQARLDDLEPEARRILRAASVLGQVFWFGAVTAMLGGEQRAAEVKSWLTVLVDREMVTQRAEGKFPGEPEFVFRHAMMREAAYDMLTDEDRWLGHRIAAEWLETAGEVDATTLAEHYERGDVPHRAVGWFMRAATQALEGNDLEAAVKLATRGLVCAAGDPLFVGPLQRTIAEAHRWRGELAEAEAAALEAMRCLEPGSADWHSAVTEVALASGRLGRPERITELFATLKEIGAKGVVSGAHVAACAQAAGVLLFTGQVDQSGELFDHIDRVLETAPGLEPSVLASVERARAMRALFAGDPSGCLAEMERAASHNEQAGDLRGACTQRVNIGYSYIELGAYGEAERALGDALAAAERLGIHMVAASARHNLGKALQRSGRLDEAIDVERAALAAAAAQGDKRIETACHTYLATMLAEAGDFDAAVREANQALELSASPPAKAVALATLADVLLQRGDATKAADVAAQADTLLEETGAMEEGEALVRLVRAKTLHASGNVAEAGAAIRLARQRLFDRAHKIRDARWRESFLQSVPEHAETLALADAWEG